MKGHAEEGERRSMSLDRARLILEAYGAAPASWPAADRPAMLALLAADGGARRLWDEAARLDAVLAGLTPPAPTDALRQRVVDAHKRAAPPRERRPWAALVLPLPRLAGFAAVAASAFALGLWLSPVAMPGNPTDANGLAAGSDSAAVDAPTGAVMDLPLVDPGSAADVAGVTIGPTGDLMVIAAAEIDGAADQALTELALE